MIKKRDMTHIVPVPMYMLVRVNKEMRRQIYKMIACFSEHCESNGRLLENSGGNPSLCGMVREGISVNEMCC